jgi:ATP-binding cassette subfamily B protein
MARHRRHRCADFDDDDLPKVKITRKTLFEALSLYRYVLPYWFKFGVALLMLAFASLLGLVFPAVVGKLVDGTLAALTNPGATQDTIWQNIDVIALGLIGVLALQAVCSFVQTYWFVEVGERSLTDLRRDTYARLIRLPMAFHTQRRVGELASRLAADLSQIQDTLTGIVPQFLRQSAILVGGTVLLFVTSPRLTLVMLLSLPVLILLTFLFGRFIRKNSKEAQDKLADSNVIVEETLQGIASVKAFSNEGYEEGRYRKGLDLFLTTILRGAKYRGAFVSFIVFALFGAVVVVLWYGARLVAEHAQNPEVGITAGELTSFMLYTLFVAGAMGSFAEIYSTIQRSLGATHRVREILREPMEPLPGEPLKPSANGDGAMPRLRGEVAFEHVAFTYPSRKELQVLRDINLAAHPGQRVALVGPSGAGKSTIVALLMRFFEADAGRILIDGRDARDYGLHELRSQMAIVPQDVLLFGGSILDNIAYGRPGATEAEVIEAARKANAHDFITSFPEGYQTRVGERGIQLSGGQRQRVAIARAILRDPAILILDEATSSLDSESESLVLQALEGLMQGRTSLIIAHRLSTVRRADRIYVIKDGATVEEGTHAELLARENGIYRMLSELQFQSPDLTATARPSPIWADS